MFQIKLRVFPMFISLFTGNSSIHDHFTRQSMHFHIPIPRLEIIRRSIYYQGPIIWNSLVDGFDIKVRITTFKRHIKSYLIENEVKY